MRTHMSLPITDSLHFVSIKTGDNLIKLQVKILLKLSYDFSEFVAMRWVYSKIKVVQQVDDLHGRATRWQPREFNNVAEVYRDLFITFGEDIFSSFQLVGDRPITWEKCVSSLSALYTPYAVQYCMSKTKWVWFEHPKALCCTLVI